MVFKKSGGKVYGVELNAAERRAFDMEARRSLAEYTRKHDLEVEALVIRRLRRLTGWGETRLKRFFADFDQDLEDLAKHYEMDTDETPWLCTRELKDEGFDIEQWHRERRPNERYEVTCKSVI